MFPSKKIFLLSLISFFSHSVSAAESLSYSGRLVQTNGAPVTGPVTIRAKLAYTNDLSNANTFCTQDLSNVDLTNGVFHVKFDFVCKISGSGVALTQFLSQTPAGESVAIQITDMTHSKSYSYQALHALPFANVASQLAQNGAGDGEFLKWSDSAKGWVPVTVAAATGGTVTNVSVSAPLSISNPTSTPSIALPQASGAQSGYLSSADWNTFNNKEGTIAGGTATQYYRGDKSWQTLDSSVVPENVNLYFTNARALGVPLTGFVVGSGAITSTDTTLSAFEKTQGQISTLSSDAAHFLKKDNTDSITGTVNVGVTGALTITNAPALPTDAANRQYVNTYADTKLALTGGTLSGALTLDSDLKIKGGSNYVTVRGHATSAAYNFVLPSSAGTSGQFLQTDGSGNLSWVAESSTATPSGAAGGDLAGAYPNPTVPGLANKISTTLTSGNILVGNGSNVATGVAVSGDATLSNAGVLTLANTAVTAGTYKSVTVDGKGRVTGGTNPTTLAGYGITDTLVTGVSVAAPITNTGTATVPLIGMPAATGAVDGYLTSANFNTFNNKQAAITSASTINTGSLTTNLQGGLVLNPYNTAAGNTGEIRFNELAAGGSNYTGFKAPDALAGNVIYTLPSTDGTSGQVLTTNASGVLSWSSHPTTAAPSGAAGGDLTGSYPNPTVANGLVATKISTGVVDNTEFNYLDGVTSSIQSQLNNKQPIDPTLTSLAAYNTNGILVQTAADTFIGRSIAGTANRLTVTDGDGVAGNPTINIPTALLPSPVAGDAGKFLKASGADTSAWTALSSSDVTTALGFTPINKAGDTMASGTFTYNGAALLRTLDPIGPTDVATKQYVDGYGQWTKGTGANAGDVYRLTGNVGVGTATPQGPLHIVSGVPSPLIFERTSANNSHIQFKNTVTSVYAGLSPAGYFGVGNNVDLNNSPSLVVLSSGSVGIGTTAPLSLFHVEKNQAAETAIFVNNSTAGGYSAVRLGPSDRATNFDGMFYSSSAATGLRAGTRPLVFETGAANAERMRIDSSGNVGVGNDSPGSILEIGKNTATSSSFRFSPSGDQSAVRFTTNGAANWIQSGSEYIADSKKDLRFSSISGTTTWMSIQGTTGNVGIGTTSPDSIIHAYKNFNGLSNLSAGHVQGIDSGPTNTDVYFLQKGAVGGFADYGLINAVAGGNSKFYVRGDGNVGINTASPTYLLDVRGAGTSLGNFLSSGDNLGYLDIQNSNSGNSAGSIARLITKNVANTANTSVDIVKYRTGGFIINNNETDASSFTAINQSGAERMRITSSGNVGIGTSAPGAKLDVSGEVRFSTASGNSSLTSNTGNRDFDFVGNVATNRILTVHPGPLAGTSYNNIVVDFYGHNGAVHIPGFTMLRNGNVGIGNTVPGYKLDVQGGGVNASGGYTQTSDIRLKTNIDNINSSEALRKVTSLNGIYYDWKDQEKFGSDHQIGLIAQEVQKVFPEAIKTNKDGFLSVSYSNLVAPVIEAIKELYKNIRGVENQQTMQSRQIASIQNLKADKAEVEILKAENERLKASEAAKAKELEEMKKRLDKIEKMLKR